MTKWMTLLGMQITIHKPPSVVRVAAALLSLCPCTRPSTQDAPAAIHSDRRPVLIKQIGGAMSNPDKAGWVRQASSLGWTKRYMVLKDGVLCIFNVRFSLWTHCRPCARLVSNPVLPLLPHCLRCPSFTPLCAELRRLQGRIAGGDDPDDACQCQGWRQRP